MAFTAPKTYTTGAVLPASDLNISAGRDNELALDATFDRLLAQIAHSGQSFGTAGTGVLRSVSVTVNDAADKIVAWASARNVIGASRVIHVRDNTDGVNGNSTTVEANQNGTVMALFTSPSVAAHTVEFRFSAGDPNDFSGENLIAWVIPNNV